MSRLNGVPGNYIPYTKNKNKDNTTKNIEIINPCDIPLPKVAKFEKVPHEQFNQDIFNNIHLDNISTVDELYDKIKLPKRATIDSAGYDFYAPFDFKLENGKSIVIPTGIRCKINPGWWLMLAPRSGSGFKYKVQLYNTIGVIDGDYYNAKNYGHIMLKLTARHRCEFKQGDGICQGIFTMYGITDDDEVSNNRVGGLGSTDVVKNQ